jgi:hypothetical protein
MTQLEELYNIYLELNLVKELLESIGILGINREDKKVEDKVEFKKEINSEHIKMQIDLFKSQHIIRITEIIEMIDSEIIEEIITQNQGGMGTIIIMTITIETTLDY